jgi:glycosyltransferase involved in cell wall biosynthesis
MQGKQKIALIKMGSLSYVNDRILELLVKHFPNFETEVIDISSELIEVTRMAKLFQCMRTYGMDIILGRKTISASIARTPYMFNKVKRAIADRLAHREYAFTFQTQSIFDASVRGIPHFTYTDHTHLANLSYPGFDRKELYAKSWIECEKQIYHNATLNFTMSSNISKSIIEDYSCDADRVACIHCGPNVPVTENEIFDESRYSNKNVLFVGIDWQRKGGPVLAEAFAIVLGTYPEATLTIVGCSPELNLPRCNVVGMIPVREVKKYYAQASIFALPARREPFGIVFVEAMAHKLPIVATNIGAIPDLVLEGKNGYLVEPNNSEQLAQRIIDLMGAPDKCNDFGEYGHKHFLESYTWERIGLRIRESIERFL